MEEEDAIMKQSNTSTHIGIIDAYILHHAYAVLKENCPKEVVAPPMFSSTEELRALFKAYVEEARESNSVYGSALRVYVTEKGVQDPIPLNPNDSTPIPNSLKALVVAYVKEVSSRGSTKKIGYVNVRLLSGTDDVFEKEILGYSATPSSCPSNAD